jgi:2-methylisocitrate lyase-like PEP mutase family enzyme
MFPVKRLQQMGYRIAIYPSETQRAAIYAMRQALDLLKRKGTTEEMDEALATFQERDNIVGLADWQKLEKLYLSVAAQKS